MVNIIQIEIIIGIIVTAITCSIIGAFVQLKRDSTIVDTASRSTLLGIVIAFTATTVLSSWFLLAMGCLTAILSVAFIETLHRNRTLTKNASAVITYSFTLSIGVVMINYFSSFTHVNVESIYAGQLAFIPYHRFIFQGHDLGPALVYVMLGVLFINIVVIAFFYKQLKLVIVDTMYANSIRISSRKVNFVIIFLISITAAASFQVLGVILTTVYFIIPAATAQFFTKKLSTLLLTSSVIAFVTCLTGFSLSLSLNVSAIATIALVMGVLFLFALIFAQEKGAMNKYMEKREMRQELYKRIMLVHLFQHSGKVEEDIENNIKKIAHHLNWKVKQTDSIIEYLKGANYAEVADDIIKLTDTGRLEAKKILGL